MKLSSIIPSLLLCAPSVLAWSLDNVRVLSYDGSTGYITIGWDLPSRNNKLYGKVLYRVGFTGGPPEAQYEIDDRVTQFTFGPCVALSDYTFKVKVGWSEAGYSDWTDVHYKTPFRYGGPVKIPPRDER